MAKLRKCLFCSTQFEYCGHCKEHSNEPTWKVNFDTERCHDLYEVMAGYGMGIKTIEDVKAVLDKHNVTDYTIFSKKVQDKLNELSPKKVEEPKVETKSFGERKNSFVPNKIKNNKQFKKSNIEE